MNLIEQLLALMFGPGAPPPPPEPKKQKKVQRLAYEDKVFDVGVSTVWITFSDGREVESKIYGEIKQYIRDCRDIFTDTELEHRYTVREAYVYSSKEKYDLLLKTFDHLKPMKIYDDNRNPTVSWTGIIQHMELAGTEKHEETHAVAFVVEDLVDED